MTDRKQIPRRQHTVSQVVLRRFISPDTEKLEAFALNYGKHYQRRTEQVGFVKDFVKYEQVATEGLWRRTEDRIPLLFEALDNQTYMDLPEAEEIAKDLLALHVVRSRTRQEVHKLVLDRAKDRVRHELLSDRDGLSSRFYQRRGFFPAGQELLMDQVEWELQQGVQSQFSDVWFQERMLVNFQEARLQIARGRVQVVEVPRDVGSFLIADDPAVQMKAGHLGLGPLGGVTWSETSTVLMPIDPQIALQLGSRPRRAVINSTQAHFMNCVQLSNARERVFYQESESLRLLATRAMAARSKRGTGEVPVLINLPPEREV